MGLLDEFSSFVKTPEGQGLLSAAFGGLATARRGEPINSMGKAGLAGLMGYGQAQDRIDKDASLAMQKQVQQMQLDEAKRKATGQSTFEASLPENLRPLAAAGYGGDIVKSLVKDPQLVTVQTPQGPMQKWITPGANTGVDIGAPVSKESALPWYVQKGQDGKVSIDPAYADFEKTKASFGRPPAQPMAPVAYVDDNGRTIWGTITDARGKQAANFSPSIQGSISSAKAEGTEIGKGAGESAVKLKSSESSLPGLENVVNELSVLGKKATYTKVGQAADSVRRQIGGNVGPGAVARKEYISKVDNEVLPLLRQTFGAQFTQKEGESLKTTLGDPEASPEEKDAVLRSFIKTKRSQIKVLKGTASADKQQTQSDRAVVRKGMYGGKTVVEYSDGSVEYAN